MCSRRACCAPARPRQRGGVQCARSARTHCARLTCFCAPRALSRQTELDAAAAERVRQRSKALTDSRKETWAIQATVESVNLGMDFSADDTVDAAMAASMAALQSALAMEESILAKTAPAVAVVPSPAAAPDAAGAAVPPAAALIDANALLGPGAGGLLPVTPAVAGSSAWDEMERRIAALSSVIEGEPAVAANPSLDAAKLEARAARMREREAKRQAKRLGLPMPAPMTSATMTAAVAAPRAPGMVRGVLVCTRACTLLRCELTRLCACALGMSRRSRPAR